MSDYPAKLLPLPAGRPPPPSRLTQMQRHHPGKLKAKGYKEAVLPKQIR